MIDLELDAHLVGHTTIGFSPLSEIACSLAKLSTPQLPHVHSAWAREVRGELGGVDMELLNEVVFSGKWMPSFMCPPVTTPTTGLAQQLAALSELSADQLAADLTPCWPAGLPSRLAGLLMRGDDAAPTLAGALSLYWEAAIAPWWVRICGVLEDDVLYRAGRTLSEGLFTLLEDLHPQLQLSGSTLHLNMPDHTATDYRAERLSLVPSAFCWPGLILNHDVPGVLGITYGARGVGRLWEGLDTENRDDDALGALLGRSRAQILCALDVPASTTDLARTMDQSPAATSRHLKVLRCSGLAESWRSGRRVLYRHTALGASLVAVATKGLAAERSCPDKPA